MLVMSVTVYFVTLVTTRRFAGFVCSNTVDIVQRKRLQRDIGFDYSFFFVLCSLCFLRVFSFCCTHNEQAQTMEPGRNFLDQVGPCVAGLAKMTGFFTPMF